MGFFTILVLLITLFAYPVSMYFDSYWSKGKIPPTYGYSRDNELEIIIAVSGIIIRKDFRDVNQKKAFLNNYFETYFKNENYDFDESFRNSYREPLLIEEASKWLLKNIPSPERRLALVQLMIDIAMVDGELLGHEYNTLKHFHTLLKLPIQNFDQMIAVHIQREERKQERTKQNSEKRSYFSKDSQIEKLCTILGLEKTENKDSIKKTYRNLVKIHHPDKYVNDSKIQQKLAQERFVEIQLAYEKLIEILG